MAEDKYSEALEAFNAKDLETTFKILNELLTNEGPSDDRVLPLLGEAFVAGGLAEEAAEVFEQAAQAESPQATECMFKAMLLYGGLGNTEKTFLLALQLNKLLPDNLDVIYFLSAGLLERNEFELLAAFKAKLIDSDNPDHLALASRIYGREGSTEDHLRLYKKLYKLVPDQGQILFALMEFAGSFNDFDTLASLQKRLAQEIENGNEALLKQDFPRHSLLWTSDEKINRLAENIFDLPAANPDLREQRRAQPHIWGEKICVGYVGNEFWDDHATMRLMRSVLTAHDPDKFEVVLFCYTPERFLEEESDRDKWGRIVSIRDMNDDDAVKAIQAAGVDILVDLKGYTGGARTGIFNRMAAPVQVSWLGYPGSCVNMDYDYIVGDKFVLPETSRPYYHEKFCRLPDSYQPNDPFTRALPKASTRQELGLPEDKVVFASFNSPQKISVETIDLWISVLKSAPNSILWVMTNTDNAEQNIVRRALMQGVMPDRFKFARKTSYEEHIARAQAADIALDSFPYNGHTTTSDMLWAGVPVITKKGRNFASRVSESLLNAMGVPELVADDNAGFVNLATKLAADPSAVRDLKRRLVENRFTAPLFDAERFCRHLETAYEMMAQEAKVGKKPDHFDVEARPSREAPFRS